MGASNLKRLPWLMGMMILCSLMFAATAWAQQTVEDVTGGQPGPLGFSAEVVPVELQQDFRQMAHYYRIARPDLAAGFAQRILRSNPDPIVLLRLVEHRDMGYSLLVQMATSQNQDLAEAAAELRTLADQAIEAQRKSGDRIVAALSRLTINDRAFQLALSELRYSGEYVAPHALAMLQDANPEQAAAIRRALLAIGRPVVWPLVVALQTEDTALKIEIIDLLGGLGYQVALPGLKATLEQENPAAVKQAAERAIRRIDASVLDRSARSLYMNLAQGLYYNRVSAPVEQNRPTTDVWGWLPGQNGGLSYRPVPNPAVNEVMASREAERGLTIAPDAPELVSFWLTIQAKMDAELRSAGVEPVNPWAPADMPTMEFYLRAAGQQYVLDVLDRALRDNDVDVARRVLVALEHVANQQYLGAGASGEGSPLIRALGYPDRLVRFDAAFAIVAVQPRDTFFGHERVVPVLAEAVNMETGPSVLIIENEAENLNRLKGAFRQADWNVAEANTGDTGISTAQRMSRIDIIVISPSIQNSSYADTIRAFRRSFTTAMIPIIVLSKEAEAVPFSEIEENFRYVAQVPANAEVDAIVGQANNLRAEAGAMALNAQLSQAISLRAAQALDYIATARTVLDARPARDALMTAAAGRNPQLAIAAISALSQMPDAEIQQHLAAIGLNAQAPQAVRVAALNGVADTARHIGNNLDAETVAAFQSRVAQESDTEIRDAIGTVLGALDLEAELASQLIRRHAILQAE